MLMQTQTGRNEPLGTILVNGMGNGLSATGKREGTTRSVRAKEHVFYEDDPRTHIFEIAEGSVCVYKLMPDGRRQIVAFCYPGDLIGMGTREEYFYNAEATSDAKLNCYPVATIERLAEQRPELSHALLAFAMAELSLAREQMLTLGRKSALERVCSFLLERVRKQHTRGEDVLRIDLPMTRTDIADYLGLTIETVSRNFSKLKMTGIIDLPHSGEVIVRDMDALESMAESSDAI